MLIDVFAASVIPIALFLILIKKVLYTKVDKIYHISNLKKAVTKSNKFKRNGKIIVGFDKNLIKKYSDLLK